MARVNAGARPEDIKVAPLPAGATPPPASAAQSKPAAPPTR
jgi:hypothetical protein